MNAELLETVNGVLAILGLVIVVLVILYLARNIWRTYHDPIRFITLAFAAVILGHTIKDSAVYLARCCAIDSPDWLIVAALAIVGLGKLGCIRIWSDPKWGSWPLIVAVALVAAFLAISAIV